MKTTFIKLVSSVALSAIAFIQPSHADTNKPTASSARIEPFGYNKKVQVRFHSANEKDLASVVIRNANREVVYEEKVKKDQDFRKVYDLSFLENGSYTLEVTNGATQTQRTFVLDKIMHTQALRVIFIASSDYKQFKIAMENLTRNKVDLLVKDENGQVVHQESLRHIYKKVVDKDFSYLKPGTYTVEVRGLDAAYSKELIVN